MVRIRLTGSLALGVLLAVAGCGGGRPVTVRGIPSAFDVRVSVGTPVVGATVTVYAISDATGRINRQAGSAGVLGSAGPTDRSGRVVVPTSAYSGPVQIVASGVTMTYQDPTAVPGDGEGGTGSPWPSDAPLSCFLTTYGSAAQMTVPVTMLTTLADHAALAYALGLHPAHAGRATLAEALAARDPLHVGHVAPANMWSPGALRSTIPTSLANGPQALVDVALASLFDVAMHQLARDTSARAGYGGPAPGVTAATLMGLLEADIDDDAILDGKGPGGAQLWVEGARPVAIDAQLLRLPLAMALDAWVRNPAVNRSGFSEADLVGAKVFQSMTGSASDLFGEPPSGNVDAVIDHAPPVVAWVTPPPVAVTGASVRLSIAASDAQTGVRRVLAQAGIGEPSFAIRQADGSWAVDLPLVRGPNMVAAWAEDNAAGGPNTGQFLAAPYQLSALVISDAIGPAVGYNAGLAQYRDERGLTVATGPTGVALVPATWRYASEVPVALPPSGGDIFKAASRLEWSTVPSTDLLEDATSGNPDNIPLLQFWAAYVDGVDAPIVEATYTVTAECAGCAFDAAVGPLWQSAMTLPGKRLWDLPLSSNLIPALARLPGPATLTVTVRFTDIAGNTTIATPVSLTFHVIGDPLAIVEDGSYAFRSDPRSTFPYTIATGLYSNLFAPDLSVFLPENRIRLVRYLVTNPSPHAVALSLPALASAWAAKETWVGSSGTSLGIQSYTPTRTFCPLPPPCSGATPISFGGGSVGFGCGAAPPHGLPPSTDVATVTSGDLTSFAYNQALGWDSSPAQVAGLGHVLVPGASTDGPGVVALYFGRPVSPPARSYVLPWTGSLYQYVVEDAWVRTWEGAAICCDFDFESRRCFQSEAPSIWSGTRFVRSLAVGVDSLQGSFQLVTRGLYSGALVGEPAFVPGVVVLTRTIPH